MGVFRQFPYSNFHEMNLDEIIKIVKNMLGEWAEYYTTWDDWKEQVTQEWSEMQDFINNYFDNLNVQTEINNKITAMVTSGEFSQIVDPYVPPAVSAWLADHITQPVGVVIDDSLTVSGACADAKVTGDSIREIEDTTDNIWINRYGTFYGITLTPTGDGGIHMEGTCDTTENIRATLDTAVTLNGFNLQFHQTQNLVANNLGLRLRTSSYQSIKYLDAVGYNGQLVGGETLSVKYLDITVFSGIVYNNDIYISLTDTNASTDIIPRLTAYDAIARTNLEKLISSLSSANPLNPILFKNMAWAKGTYTFTDIVYDLPQYVNDNLTAYNNASAGADTAYSLFAYEMISDARITKITNIGQTIDNLAFIIKTNKAMTITLYLAMSRGWGGVYNSVASASVLLKEGVNFVKPVFNFVSDTSSATKYTYLLLQCGIYNDLVLDLSVINSTEFYEWITSALNDIEAPSYNTDLLCWGDSITNGYGGGGVTYPEVCANELDITFINAGTGGETANTIAVRQGGNNLVIPKGAVNGTYTLAQMEDIFGGLVAPLRQGTGWGSASKIYINGEECNIAVTQESSTDPNATYTISGYTGGTSKMSLLGKFIGSTFKGKIVTILVGTNGYAVGSDTSNDALITIIDSMIKHIGHDKYVVMGLTNGDSSTRDALDALMLNHYGAKFFPSRTMLIDNGLSINDLTPTADDITYMNAGIVPESLRIDSTHLNAYGYTALGKMLADKIKSLGYI